LLGHPGETEAEFEALYDFVKKQRFDRLGVFTYSHEENTHAYSLADDVPAEIKEQRAAALMELQMGISEEKNAGKLGKTYKVLFDRLEGDHFVGRTESDSPEVDNEVWVDAKPSG
jgi:ribosomal protein S12 methylthiotransferase